MREAVKITLLIFCSTLALLLGLVIIIFLVARNSQEKETSAKNEVGTTLSTKYFRGFSFSPKSSNIVDINNFYSEVKQFANTVTWAGSWDELSNKNGTPYSLGKTLKQKNLEFIALVGTHQGGGTLRPHKELNEKTKAEYINSAASFTKNFKPNYFVMGVEVNRIYEQDRESFDAFVDLFAQAAMEIEKNSPTTKKVVVFQLEQLKGLKGGLFGGVNDPAKNLWELTNKFPEADVLGFTTYPGLIYKDPVEIPSNYYNEIATKTNKEVIFTEVGWSSGDDKIAGWESSENEQTDFVTRFFELTNALDPKVTIWSFLYDNNYGQPFNNIGLINEDGLRKKALLEWKELAP